MGFNNFNEVSQELKTDAQIFGAIIFTLYYLQHSSSIPLLSITAAFMLAYIGQKVVKIILFMEKFSGSQDPSIISDEQKIYVGSFLLNFAQMFFSYLGIG